FGARLDLDEAGGAVVDLMISPVRESRGKPVISTQKALKELKEATGERNEYSALQTSWADWSRAHLDHRIERGTRKEITRRQHLSPETYGLVKDQARSEAAQERDSGRAMTRTLRMTSEGSPEALQTLRDGLLLQREAQSHKRNPRGYEPPRGKWDLDESLAGRLGDSPWPIIEDVREPAMEVLTAAMKFGVSMDDDQNGYDSGKMLFPALADRMHLTAALAKCAEFCARTEAFVKNLTARVSGKEALPYPDYDGCWPEHARQAVERNERSLGLRPPEASHDRSEDDGLGL
ncbi:hypothetical protein, partial [Pseudoruegeria sp. SK021]|uniref:hypothetical protein n=1 Tax=Pseudoruegeria sp. SK021 TaxID=1933035 RepID=UPI000A25237E